MAIKCGGDIYEPQRIKPNDSGDTLTSLFAPVFTFEKLDYLIDHHKPSSRHPLFPDNKSSKLKWRKTCLIRVCYPCPLEQHIKAFSDVMCISGKTLFAFWYKNMEDGDLTKLKKKRKKSNKYKTPSPDDNGSCFQGHLTSSDMDGKAQGTRIILIYSRYSTRLC